MNEKKRKLTEEKLKGEDELKVIKARVVVLEEMIRSISEEIQETMRIEEQIEIGESVLHRAVDEVFFFFLFLKF